MLVAVFVTAFIAAIVSFLFGIYIGGGFRRIDIDTFDAQARIIRYLSQQLAENRDSNAN